MPKTRILCILSTILGNKAMAGRLIEALSHIADVEPILVLVEPDDYHKYRAPAWAKATDPWESQYVAWRKAQPYLAQPFDMLLVNSWEYAICFRHAAQRVPAAVLMDAVPATMDRQNRERGNTGWKRRVAHSIHSFAFRRAIGEYDYLLPMGSDCADSLVTDCHCARQRCFVTLAPQDLDVWKPAPRTYSSPLQLLFVGNDFQRKGGEFLLKLFSTHLATTCRLVIASNDPTLAARAFPEGVELIRGRSRDQLMGIYRESDVFILPSRQDFMPQVICEALAMGLPCIANDVGGIRDLVHTGQTGILMACTDPAELWARKIRELATNTSELAKLSAGAREFAEANLGIPRFERLIADTIAGMRLLRKPASSKPASS